MARRWFTEAHQIFQTSLRRFVEKEIIPNIDRWEEERMIPRQLWKKLGENGFLCACLPEQYGGSDVDYSYSVIIQEELGRSTCTGISVGARVHSDVAVPYIAEFGTPAQKETILPGCTTGDIIMAIAMTEPGCGSDLAAIKTTAVKEGHDYIINGQKTFISNGICCDWVVVAVKTDSKATPAHRGVSLILIPADAPGFSKGQKLKKMGMHSQDTAELIFDDCRVPVENLLGEEGKGFQILMKNLQAERLVISLAAIVNAEKMLNVTLAYTKDRKAFGKPISSFQANAFKLVEMATEVELGRTLVESLIEDYLEGRDISRRVSMAKWWITEMANRLAYQCVQLHGGYGYMDEYVISRMYRDVRVQPILGGTNEVMKRILAQMMGL
ncbi:MAG: acyl-CoA dehydrogenase [Desulfatitalea sp.]|nr:acyl-CoA dehydrogenase family protein [Desulfatitalea sp.]NNJ99064.1 acyl-CoA dehydrogenase [Desulfatitalea sp.]